jgi:AcrR family transcriptional regulator
MTARALSRQNRANRLPDGDRSSQPTRGNRSIPLTRGDRSRRAILDAALPNFARNGYTAASLNQIIEASGLTKGGVYFHFPSKQALALAVIEDHRQGLLERVWAEVRKHPSG